MTATDEVAILRRIIEPDNPALSPELARMILQWRFADPDRQRMKILLAKAKQGTLSRSERADAEVYERVGHVLSILKAKARASLKPKRTAS